MTWINGLGSIDCVKLKAFNAFYGPQISPNNPNKRVVFCVKFSTNLRLELRMTWINGLGMIVLSLVQLRALTQESFLYAILVNKRVVFCVKFSTIHV